MTIIFISVPMTREKNLFTLFFLTPQIDLYNLRKHVEKVSLILDKSWD